MTGKDCVALAIICGFNSGCRLWRSQSGADRWKLAGPAGVRQEAEMTDAAEPFRQHVEQEAADELVSIERHHLGLVVRAYSRDKTRTGRKKLGRQSTQRPSGASPPPGTTQWACG
jgi:hypothetical protein